MPGVGQFVLRRATLRPSLSFRHSRRLRKLFQVVLSGQHPARGLPKLRPPLREDEVWLRVEDQALVALPESRGVLFGIRMTVIPLAEVKRQPAAARGLARALRTMPDAMLDYKSLLAAKEELLRLLAV